MQEIEFKSGGVKIAGDLFLPPDIKSGERRPGLVLSQGFGGLKSGISAVGKFFAEAGYVTLSIDYRSFGKSGGEIRNQLFPLDIVEDLRNAISYLETRPEVEPERIGIWGVSFGGSFVLGVGAADRRARVVIAQVPVIDGRHWMRGLRSSYGWEEMLNLIEDDRRRRFKGEQGGRVPTVRHYNSPEICGMPGDEYANVFSRKLEQKVEDWPFDLTIESLEKIIEFNPSNMIGYISPRPLCIITVSGMDAIHPIEQINEAYARAGEPKRFALLPYDQLGLYEAQGQIDALNQALEYLNEFLPVGRNVGGKVSRSRMR